jgi:hypothetical protein
MPSIAEIINSLNSKYTNTKTGLESKIGGYNDAVDAGVEQYLSNDDLGDRGLYTRRLSGWKIVYDPRQGYRDKVAAGTNGFYKMVDAQRDLQDVNSALNAASYIKGSAAGQAEKIASGEANFLSGVANNRDSQQASALNDLFNAAARSGQRGKSFEKTQRARINSIYQDALLSDRSSAQNATNAYIQNVAGLFGDTYDSILNSEVAGRLDGKEYARKSGYLDSQGKGHDVFPTRAAVTNGPDRFGGAKSSFDEALSGLQGAQYTEAANPFSSAVPGAKLFQMASQAARRDASRTGATPIDYLRNPRIRQRYKLFS